jgi:hypothetical protein
LICSRKWKSVIEIDMSSTRAQRLTRIRFKGPSQRR